MRLLGLELPNPMAAVQYILSHTQELALDPRPLIIGWHATSGRLDMELEQAPGMGQLDAGGVYWCETSTIVAFICLDLYLSQIELEAADHPTALHERPDAEVLPKLMQLYKHSYDLEALDSSIHDCGGRMFLQTLCANGSEARVVTSSVHLLLEAAEMKMLLTTPAPDAPQDHGQSATFQPGMPTVEVAVEDLQVILYGH